MKELEQIDQEFIESWISRISTNLYEHTNKLIKQLKEKTQIRILMEVGGEKNQYLLEEEKKIWNMIEDAINRIDFCHEMIKNMRSMQFTAVISAYEKAVAEKLINLETYTPGIELERIKTLAEKYS